MPLREIRIDELVICEVCRKVFLATDWNPTDILRAKCPKCGLNGLYWAVKLKEEM